MKLSLVIILTLISATLSGQVYSKIIPDSSVIDFMSWFFKSQTLKSDRYVAKGMETLMPYNFEYKTTTEYAFPFGNIFAHNKSLFKILSKKDADFFVRQIEGQEEYYWNFRINGVKLFNAENETTPKNQVVYFYSIPLFSNDKKMVILSTGYIRGDNYAGGVYYLFKKDKNSWTKIKEFQKWGD